MTKKDYQLLAGALYGAKESGILVGVTAREMRSDIIGRIARVLAADNPRFDRETFAAACEDGNVGRQPRTVHKANACDAREGS